MTIPKLSELIRNKKFIIGTSLILGTLVLLAMSLSSNKLRQNEQPASDVYTISLAPSQAAEMQAAALQQAIAAQQKTDQEYSDWQESTRTNYPWIKVLPLYGDKYFLYFDISKKVFVGKIYPGVTDNIDQIKTQITTELNDKLKGENIDSSSFKYEWKIIPQ